eukprot:902093-Pyramimonas_sp.AAC.2
MEREMMQHALSISVARTSCCLQEAKGTRLSLSEAREQTVSRLAACMILPKGPTVDTRTKGAP